MGSIAFKEPQKIAIPFLRSVPRAALWGSCGIGKTTSALFVVDALLLTGEADGPTLVAAPARVARDVWTADAAKWDNFKHLRVVQIGGTPTQRIDILRRRPWAEIYTISYELLPWLVEYFTDKWPFRQVIADESDNLKGFRLTAKASAVQDPTKPLKSGHSGKRAHAIGRVAHTLVKRWINLTGTPAGNGLKDLWGQTWYLDRGERLGRTHGAFMQRWFRTNQYTGTIEPLPYARDQIHAALKDICLTLDARDYFDLHEPLVTTIPITLPAEARRIYKELEKDMFAELGDGQNVEVFNAAALTNKCLQLANGAVYTQHPAWKAVHDEKIEALKSIVAEAGGSQILVAYEFISDADRICSAFKSVARLADPSGLAAFKAGTLQIGLAHPKSLAYGTDGLHHNCYTLVRFGHGWNLTQRIQMLERIGPMRQLQGGYDRVVMVYDLIAVDTLDEDAILRHESKREVQDLLLEAMKRRG